MIRWVLFVAESTIWPTICLIFLFCVFKLFKFFLVNVITGVDSYFFTHVGKCGSFFLLVVLTYIPFLSVYIALVALQGIRIILEIYTSVIDATIT